MKSSRISLLGNIWIWRSNSTHAILHLDFYDAIRKESLNQPIEAIRDLQQSIDLNDNRAVYRSRLLLNEDLAARSATLGRIYSEVGFEQLALVEGWRSLNTDPANYSAHRLLADSYSALPRHEIARVSELLQSQLFQPINITPVQPQLATAKLFILQGTSPGETALNEYNPLFVQDRPRLLAAGVAGSNAVRGDEVILAGVEKNLSYSFGQFYYNTDGFRENNDLTRTIYNAFSQASLSSTTSILAEWRYSDANYGDLPLRFNLKNFLPTLRQMDTLNSERLDLRHAFSEQSQIIVQLFIKISIPALNYHLSFHRCLGLA